MNFLSTIVSLGEKNFIEEGNVCALLEGKVRFDQLLFDTKPDQKLAPAQLVEFHQQRLVEVEHCL